MFEDTLLSRTFAYPIVQSACNVFSNWCIWCSKSIEEISKLELIEWLKGHPFDTGGVRCGLGEQGRKSLLTNQLHTLICCKSQSELVEAP